MDFSLSAEHDAYLERVRAFARDRVAPAAAKIDETGAFPRALISEAAALGLMGVTMPVEAGGAGRDYVSYAMAMEAVSQASATVAVILTVNNSLVVEPIAESGTAGQKARWLGPLASGRAIGAFALSEANAGSDAANQQAVARAVDGGYVLRGTKVWVANGEAADVAIVFASTDPSARARGISAFLVPMDTPGITRKASDSLGVRGLGCTDMEFHDVRVDSTAMLGEIGRGFKLAMRALVGGRIAIAAQALASARPRWKRRWRTRGAARSSVSRSAISRPCSFSSRTWPPTSRPRACSPGAPPTAMTARRARSSRHRWPS
jgi:alkylation response protein AidB-like acyl-CoA dehydrogenase